jgi:hypothetical protein
MPVVAKIMGHSSMQEAEEVANVSKEGTVKAVKGCLVLSEQPSMQLRGEIL